MRLAEKVARRFLARRRRQRGQAKVKRKQRYRRQKAQSRRQAKQWRRKNRSKVKRYRKKYKRNPTKFKMRKAGSVAFAEEMPFWDLEHGIEGDVDHIDVEGDLVQTKVNGEPREYGLDTFLDSTVIITEDGEEHFFGELDRVFEIGPDDEDDWDADDDGVPDTSDPGFDLTAVRRAPTRFNPRHPDFDADVIWEGFSEEFTNRFEREVPRWLDQSLKMQDKPRKIRWDSPRGWKLPVTVQIEVSYDGRGADMYYSFEPDEDEIEHREGGTSVDFHDLERVDAQYELEGFIEETVDAAEAMLADVRKLGGFI
jgi:hypothetical protein